jgi:hypothetical protein
MGRLYQVACACFFGFCAFWSAGSLAAQDFCPLVVRAVSPDGQRPEVSISVEERNGRNIELEQGSEDVRFCDLGILPVTVTVGLAGCNQVQVKDVPLSWASEYLLLITYDVSPCLKESPRPPIPVCHVLFRVADERGRWIVGASIRFDETSLRSLITDAHGRALHRMTLNQHVQGSIQKSGYAPRQFSISCTRSEPNREMLIKLTLKN